MTGSLPLVVVDLRLNNKGETLSSLGVTADSLRSVP